jgi:hypothetical protein
MQQELKLSQVKIPYFVISKIHHDSLFHDKLGILTYKLRGETLYITGIDESISNLGDPNALYFRSRLHTPNKIGIRDVGRKVLLLTFTDSVEIGFYDKGEKVEVQIVGLGPTTILNPCDSFESEDQDILKRIRELKDELLQNLNRDIELIK